MRNSIDSRIINEVATLWVELGGDAEGLLYCWPQIRDRIEEIIQEKHEKISTTEGET